MEGEKGRGRTLGQHKQRQKRQEIVMVPFRIAQQLNVYLLIQKKIHILRLHPA